MKNLLANAKQHLIEVAIEVYLDRRGDLEIEEYKDHFGNLGSLIAIIDSFDSFTKLVLALGNGYFEVIGYFPSDEDMLESFLENIGLA